MRPFWSDDHLTLYGGDCRAVMAEMPPESVHCVVTSPPYWGLRDYGTEGQLGLEATPEAYVANMVDVFREVRRVLRADGTLWLNLGDSYAASANTGGTKSIQGTAKRIGAMTSKGHGIPDGLKPKDLVGIPWRVAFALQADGWYLRSDIIWAKPNPMPESVTDRPTKAHEYLFLLSKSPRYYFDAEAVREPDSGQDHRRAVVGGQPSLEPSGGILGPHTGIRTIEGRNGSGRNLRSVWTIATEQYGNVTPASAYADGPLDTLSPDCPVHSLRAIRRTTRTDGDDALLDRLRSRSPRTGRRPAQAPDDGLFASSDLDSPGGPHSTTGSPRPGSSGEPTPRSTPENRSPDPATAGDAPALIAQTASHTSRTPSGSTSPAAVVPSGSGEPAASRRNGHESRTTGESDAPGSSAHSTADRTPDMDVESGVPAGQCSCPKYSSSHFATFPRKLVEPCVKAGCPEGGTVLDPFAGSGTTLLVAQALGRRGIGIDLSPDYLKQALARNAQTPLGLGAA